MGETAQNGLARDRLDPWLAERIDGAEPPFSFERIAGGRSNLTYRMTDSRGRAWILRRPPMGARLGARHGARAPDPRRARPRRPPRADAGRDVRGRGRHGRAVLRHGLRGRA